MLEDYLELGTEDQRKIDQILEKLIEEVRRLELDWEGIFQLIKIRK